jgi:hypothetical protein
MEYLHQDEKIAAAIGDIFWNADLCTESVKDDGTWVSYDPEKLLAQADIYAGLIKTISGIEVNPEVLVRDFMDRLA